MRVVVDTCNVLLTEKSMIGHSCGSFLACVWFQTLGPSISRVTHIWRADPSGAFFQGEMLLGNYAPRCINATTCTVHECSEVRAVSGEVGYVHSVRYVVTCQAETCSDIPPYYASKSSSLSTEGMKKFSLSTTSVACFHHRLKAVHPYIISMVLKELIIQLPPYPRLTCILSQAICELFSCRPHVLQLFSTCTLRYPEHKQTSHSATRDCTGRGQSMRGTRRA